MADCVKICQNLASLCCDGIPLAGSAVITLTGGDPCQLYDAADKTWVTPGIVGTFAIGAVTANQWISCELACLEDLTGPGGQTAIALGFYYNITVTVAGTAACTYQVALDCTTLGLAAGATAKLEDIIVATPSTPVPGSALCTAFAACETTTTLVNNNDNTYTYTNEAGTTTVITAGTGTGGGNSTMTAAGSILTHTSGSGVVSTFDICGIVGANCENNLSFDATSGNLTLTQHGGGTSVVNIGGQETVTTLVNNGNNTYTYTSENGTQTILTIPAQVTTNLVDNGDGTLSYTNETGAVQTFTAPAQTITTFVANGNGTYTYTSEDGTVTTTAVASGTGNLSVLTPALTAGNAIATHNSGATGAATNTIFETATTLVNNIDGTSTYTNEAGIATIIPADVVTTLVNNVDGTSTYTNEAGTTTILPAETVTTLTVLSGIGRYTSEDGTVTTFQTSDREKETFVHRDLVTTVSSSGLAIDDSGWEVYAYAVTVDVAPTAAETFNLIDRGAAGAGTTNIFSGTLGAGALTTGIVTLGTPYTVVAGNLVQSNILTVNGSEKWTLTVYYRELVSELTV